MTMAAGQMRIALRAVGTAGAAEAARGGFGGGGRAFRLVQQTAGDTGPTQVRFGVLAGLFMYQTVPSYRPDVAVVGFGGGCARAWAGGHQLVR
jgi:hypothetical protein